MKNHRATIEHCIKKQHHGWLPWVLWLLVWWAGGNLSAQTKKSAHRFIHISQKQGLAGVKPTCVFQDYYGYIWIGTWEGLYRFDGYSCQLFEHNPEDPFSLPSNFIAYHAFFEDENKDLWITTFDAGIVKFDRKTEQFKALQKKQFPRQLNGICGDGEGGVWIATRGMGLGRYSPPKDSIYLYSLRKDFPSLAIGADRLNDVCLAQNGRLWIGTGLGLAGLSPQGIIQHYLPSAGSRRRHLSDAYILDVYEDRQNRIWACSKNGLNRINEKGEFIHFFPDPRSGHPGNSIQRVYEHSDGGFWVGTQGGLYQFDPESAFFTPVLHDPLDPLSIAKGGIHGIFEDRQKRLWLSADGGLCLFDKTISNFRDSDWDRVKAILPPVSTLYNGTHLAFAGDRYWVGNEKGLFHFTTEQSVQQFRFSNKVVNVTTLMVDRHGKLYVGTSEGPFYVLDPARLQVESVLKKDNQTVRSTQTAIGLRNTAFAEDQQGRVWMGALGVLNSFDPANKQYRQYYHDNQQAGTLSNSNINDLLVDRRGNLWVGTMKGVNKIAATQLAGHSEFSFQHFIHEPQNPNTISNNHVRVVFQDSRDWMWFGTDAGLNLLYPDGRWRRFLKAQGLPENHITGIVEDKDGNLWVTTQSKGIAKYHIDLDRFQSLGILDGLSTEQFPANSVLMLSDGRLVFAGTGGIDVIDPVSVVIRADSFPLYFTELKLFNRSVQVNDASGLLRQPVYLTDTLVLKYTQNVISLHFAALNFTNPEKQIYRFRLDGFRKLDAWQDIGAGREISLTNLFPGTYTLRVESTNQPGNREHWESGQTLTIIVKPPWYGQWWAIILYGCTFFGGLYGLYKFRLRRKLAAAETLRLRELDAIKTALYTNITHEFRTPLTVVLGEAAELEKLAAHHQKGGLSAIRRQAGRLLQLVNQLLDMAKVEAGAMPKQWVQTDVVLYLKYMLESFHSLADNRNVRLRFESQAAELWMDCDLDKWQKIFYNLLSNALKFTPNGGAVTLQLIHDNPEGNLFDTNAGQLRVIVSDTGQGVAQEDLPFIFERFYQAEPLKEGSGIGLALTKELVQLLGGSIHVESAPMQGTRFILTFPIMREADKQPVFKPGDLSINADDVMLQPDDPGIAMPGNMTPRGRKNRPRLLLVEDNPDVARYITHIFEEDYQILQAASGDEGLAIVFKHTPDLIICDVMIPGMNGFEVCRSVKTDERSSHIPVILLTAKADQDSKVEGLGWGADAFIAKPFDVRELKIQMLRLLELRQTLQARYSTYSTSPGNAFFEREDAFFEKLCAVLEANFSHPDFGVPELCRAMAMSRPNLYRKIRALTGRNIEAQIRSFRLQKAYNLLRGTDMIVQEVAWACGFKEPAHFTRAFHAAFGWLPTQVR